MPHTKFSVRGNEMLLCHSMSEPIACKGSPSQKKLPLTPAVLVIVTLVIALSACTSPNAAFKKNPKIYEMLSIAVRPVDATSDQTIAWIDKDRILFEGLDKFEKDPVERISDAGIPLRALYIWNFRTGSITRYSTEPLRSRMCFSDGVISYTVLRVGRRVRLEGPFGQEKEVSVTGEERLNPFTCKWYDPGTLPKPIIGGGIEPLREGHGWVEHTGSTTWLRRTDGNLTQIVEHGRAIGTVRPQKYLSLADKYIFWRASSNRTWLIGPAGTLEALPQPKPPFERGAVEPAAGDVMLLRSTQINVRREWDIGEAGLYSYTPITKPRRLTSGLIGAMQVYRDGCLVALVVDPWNREGRERRLRAVDLCR
jgi:hypothetical protein